MVLNEKKEERERKGRLLLDMVPLEQVTRFKYLGSWITEDARSDEDIRARVGWQKQPFAK